MEVLRRFCRGSAESFCGDSFEGKLGSAGGSAEILWRSAERFCGSGFKGKFGSVERFCHNFCGRFCGRFCRGSAEFCGGSAERFCGEVLQRWF